ncbi:hypothetical protein Tco_1229635 [Tanacetum coccineum]
MCPELMPTESKKIWKLFVGFPEGIKGNMISSRPLRPCMEAITWRELGGQETCTGHYAASSQAGRKDIMLEITRVQSIATYIIMDRCLKGVVRKDTNKGQVPPNSKEHSRRMMELCSALCGGVGKSSVVSDMCHGLLREARSPLKTNSRLTHRLMIVAVVFKFAYGYCGNLVEEGPLRSPTEISFISRNWQVPLNEIEIDENLHFVEELIEIVERDVKNLKRSH